MKSKIILLLLGMVALIATVVACSDNPSFGGQNDKNKELILKAKSLVQAQGNAVSLPKVKKPGNDKELSRSNTNAIVEATLLWDEAKTYIKENETVVLVPMQNDEEICSKVTIKTGENETYQFAKTFSKLVMVFRGEETISRVFTYLPESNYAYDNKEALNNLGIDLKEAGFHGFVLVTFLNGDRSHVFRYEHGALYSILRKGNAHSHENCKDTACEHNENTPKTTVSIKLFTEQLASRSTAYTSDSERQPCKEVGTPSICTCSNACQCSFYCDCKNELNCLCGLDEGGIEYCNSCNKLRDFCTCFPGEEGETKCEICKKNPCVCCNCGTSCSNTECNCEKTGVCTCK